MAGKTRSRERSGAYALQHTESTLLYSPYFPLIYICLHGTSATSLTDCPYSRHREDSAIVARSQIRTWAAVRDGNLETAEQSLDAIEALAEDAMHNMA